MMEKPEVRFPSLFTIISAVIALKFTLIFSYFSTDFEVHRNWLAITYNLPVSKWYFEETSEWTLDYPPFFAWMEWILAHFAKFFDAEILKIVKKNNPNFRTIFFQRISVIILDLVYVYGSLKLAKVLQKKCQWSAKRSKSVHFVSAFLFLTNVGLIFVDSIHFQYNGFLFGIFLLSLSAMLEERYLLGGFWFAVLLNFKHIFLYYAPAYFAFILRNFCLKFSSKFWTKNLLEILGNFSKIGAVVFLVFGASFGPFIYWGQMGQIFSRLFPFQRGLTHAFWAPNFWAIYNFVDWIFYNFAKFVLKRKNLPTPVYTSGLVQQFEHIFLPNVSPLICGSEKIQNFLF